MKSEDNSGNVFALFPGIDTTPFTSSPEAGDEGWSALPEPSITVDEPRRAAPDGSGPGPRRPRRPGIGRAAAVASVVVAIIAGAAFAATQALLSHQAKKPGVLSASRTHHSAVHHPAHLWFATSVRPRSGSRIHRRHVAKKKHRPATRSRSVTLVSAPVSPPVTTETAASATSQSENVSAPSTSSSRGTHHAGPTGTVSLIGAGTTPSG